MAAARLADRVPFGAASVAAICEGADVARATFFLHFPGKPDLLAALAAGLEAPLEAALRGASPRAAAVLRALADALFASPGIARWVISAEQDAGGGRLHACVERALCRLSEAGELRRGATPELLARILLGAAAAVLPSEPGGDRASAQRDALLGVLLSGAAEGKPRVKLAARG